MREDCDDGIYKLDIVGGSVAGSMSRFLFSCMVILANDLLISAIMVLRVL